MAFILLLNQNKNCNNFCLSSSEILKTKVKVLSYLFCLMVKLCNSEKSETEITALQ